MLETGHRVSPSYSEVAVAVLNPFLNECVRTPFKGQGLVGIKGTFSLMHKYLSLEDQSTRSTEVQE